MIIAGAIHDHQHQGYNNMFLINTKHELAVRYNDISVLESHHVASSYDIFNKKEYNIFQEFSPEAYSQTRK
jgi:3',5'-cyclic-nucleotide phosphodiesterase